VYTERKLRKYVPTKHLLKENPWNADESRVPRVTVNRVDDTAMSIEELDISILKSLFDSSPQGVLLVHDGEIIYVNKALCSSVGIDVVENSKDQLKEFASIIAPGFKQESIERYRSIVSGNTETDIGRHEYVGKDGKKRFLDMTSNTFQIGNNKYLISYSVDATTDQQSLDSLTRERKAYGIIAEAALSTESIEELCDRILTGLVSTLGFDLGTMRLYDEKDQNLYLKASVGIEEGTTPEVVHKDDPTYLVARTARTLSPLFAPDIEQSPESKDRMTRAKELKIRSLIFWPIIGSDQTLLGVINIAAKEPKPLGQDDRTLFTTIAGMFSTILERRYAERELRDSQDRFIAFADNMPGPVYIKDDQSKVLFINRYMRDVSRMPVREDWEGKSNIDLFSADRAEELTEEDQRVLDEGPLDRVQNTVRDGKIRTFRTHKFPIRREGIPPLIGGFSIDITEQVEAQKQREIAKARAEFFNDLMAHDLNNMHQGIMSSLELILSEDNLSEHLRKMAESALKQVNRSVSLINNVKKFSIVNQQDLILDKTDPAESLNAAIQIVSQSFPQQKITIETNLNTGMYCIMANEFLQDLFYNLLHNAVKATQTDDVRVMVSSSLTEEGEYLKLDFEDWGTGIDDRLKENILTGIDERVRRVSGVGLTLVKQIIDQYNGKVWIEDRVKGDHTQGARVVVLLPNGC
jgi:PAS domain S-box-containing protein